MHAIKMSTNWNKTLTDQNMLWHLICLQKTDAILKKGIAGFIAAIKVDDSDICHKRG